MKTLELVSETSSGRAYAGGIVDLLGAGGIEVEVRGEGIAHVLVKVGERDVDVRLRFTELYVEKDGAWKMALWHSTRVP